jgi:hypothetical protein
MLDPVFVAEPLQETGNPLKVTYPLPLFTIHSQGQFKTYLNHAALNAAQRCANKSCFGLSADGPINIVTAVIIKQVMRGDLRFKVIVQVNGILVPIK